jgi:hypothetical protein
MYNSILRGERTLYPLLVSVCMQVKPLFDEDEAFRKEKPKKKEEFTSP